MTVQIGPARIGSILAGWGYAIATFWNHSFLDGRYVL